METLTCIALARELHRLLRGIRVLGAEQGDAGRTLLIHLRRTSDAARGSGWLMLSACAGESTLFFCPQKPKLPGCLWPAPLSTQVEGAVVQSVSHRGMDRTAVLSLRLPQTKNEETALLIELFAARARAYLIDLGTHAVLGSFGARRTSGIEKASSAHTYAPPVPPKDKLDPLELNAEALAEGLPPAVTEADLVERVLGVGTILAREVIARSDRTGRGAAEALKDLVSAAAEGSAQGYVVLPVHADKGSEVHDGGQGGTKTGPAGAAERRTRTDAGGDAPASTPPRTDAEVHHTALTFDPLTPGATATRRCPSVNEAVRLSFQSCRRLTGELEQRRRAAKEVRAELRRATRTRRALLEELEDAGGADEHRRMGELILANIGKIARGISEIELPDPGGDGTALRAALDPVLSPAENAAAYFRRARKLKKKLSLLPGRIEELESREHELISELERVETGGLGPTAQEPSAGGRRETRRGGKWPTGVCPRRFVSSDGWIIYVGRNNKENEYLTFHFAKPDDFWFHAQGVPGSHVVLRREGRKAKPSKRCIEETASVAAYFSKGRTSQTVSVIYTEKRHVRKPRKAKPGTALCSRERAVMVSPRLPRETS